MGPMPRGPLILCIGPKFGCPGGEKHNVFEERNPEIFSLLHMQYVIYRNTVLSHTLWSCRVHVLQHGMRTRTSTWWLVAHPDGGTSWASSKARRHEGLEKAWRHGSSWHAFSRGHPSHHRTGGCCCTVIMEGFCFAGVVTCLSPLWCSAIQVPEYTPPGM